jgi:hypothetical protein
MTGDSQEGSGRDRAIGEPGPALRGGGLPLPGLKHWRLRRGLSWAERVRRADLTHDYLLKVEWGRRGCKSEAAQRLADLLKVNLQDLRRKYDDTLETKVPPSPPPQDRLQAGVPGLPEDPLGWGGELRLRGFLGSLDHDGQEVFDAVRCRKCGGKGRIRC